MFIDFHVVFKFVEFSCLHAGEVITGKRYASDVYGRLKMIDDGKLVIAVRG